MLLHCLLFACCAGSVGRRDRVVVTSGSRREPSRGALLASVNRALWGEISIAVRAVYYQAEGSSIAIRFVVDGVIAEADRESVSCVAGEVIADFPDHDLAEESIERLDAPARVAVPPGWRLAFLRRESSE